MGSWFLALAVSAGFRRIAPYLSRFLSMFWSLDSREELADASQPIKDFERTEDNINFRSFHCQSTFMVSTFLTIVHWDCLANSLTDWFVDCLFQRI